MIDLHLHLDGSLTPRDLLHLSRSTGVALPTEREEDLRALMTFDGRGTLNEYLKKFDLPLSVLQSGEAVEYAVKSLGDRLAAMGCEYAEVRFAPMLHTRRGATAESIVKSACRGAQESALPMRLLLCCMRGQSNEKNLCTVELAAAWREKGVAGVDLAGAEALYPTENYREVFALAAKLDIDVTIHAGEAAGADSIRAALDFGAKRIGHGVAAARDEALLERLRRERILIEVCPTSNLQTGAVKRLKDHPIKLFLERGIPVALCSDNMTVSDTSVPKEWERIKKTFSFENDIFAQLTRTAKEFAFGDRVGGK